MIGQRRNLRQGSVNLDASTTTTWQKAAYRRIGVMTREGDATGMNNAVRAAVRMSIVARLDLVSMSL